MNYLFDIKGLLNCNSSSSKFQTESSLCSNSFAFHEEFHKRPYYWMICQQFIPTQFNPTLHTFFSGNMSLGMNCLELQAGQLWTRRQRLNWFSIDGVGGELSWGELSSITSSLNFWYFLPLLMFVRCEKSIKCDWITAYFSGIFAVILCCYKQLPFYRWRVAPVQSIPLQPFVRKKVIVIMRWFTGGRRQFPLVWICLG